MPVPATPHPIDPSGNLPGTNSGPNVGGGGSGATPAPASPHPIDPSGNLPGTNSGPNVRPVPTTGSRIPVMVSPQTQPSTTTQSPTDANRNIPTPGVARPSNENQRPTVARHLYTPGG
jgi:hypothetical protein